ncbi:hypothetical protein Dda_0258 [Drechslerella dactyloides]|uniref:Uncharacterized protein n=1 Tax=Drechslerella dactyloides TaxID=74499 RepID=A0AAD6NLS5_DREDA|nr:hypothetical protein Dda_0258 [Drechslerella dactyloides]
MSDHNLKSTPFSYRLDPADMRKDRLVPRGTVGRALSRLIHKQNPRADDSSERPLVPPLPPEAQPLSTLDIPNEGTVFGALCYDPNIYYFKECIPVHGDNFVVPDDYPDLEHLKQAPFQAAFLSSGRLWNTQNKNAESGFWMEPGIFVSALHFAEWSNQLPTESELLTLTNDTSLKFTVSVADTSMGWNEDPNKITVFPDDYFMSSDIALFVPQNSSQTPRNTLSLDVILEAHEIQAMSEELKGARAFAVGYNGTPDREIDDWVYEYQNRLPVAPRRLLERELIQILQPYRKSITHGNITELDFTINEIKVDCTMYKGYSGSLIGVQSPGAPKQLLVIGIASKPGAVGVEDYEDARSSLSDGTPGPVVSSGPAADLISSGPAAAPDLSPAPQEIALPNSADYTEVEVSDDESVTFLIEGELHERPAFGYRPQKDKEQASGPEQPKEQSSGQESIYNQPYGLIVTTKW